METANGSTTISYSAGKETMDHTTTTYESFPLVQSMRLNEKKRTACLEEEGKVQMQYPSSNAGWMKTLFILKGRALDRIAWPCFYVVLHALVYTILQELVFEFERESTESWVVFFR